MTANVNPVLNNIAMNGGIANIRNIAQCYEAVNRTLQRNPLLPGISAFYGPSGFGKSTAANYVATKTNAFYVQVKSTYTKKAFAQALLREMSIPMPGTLSEMMELASAELAKSGRPLIIDEFDHLVNSSKVEIVRDLYEASQGTFLIIGEELLARKLEKWERFHGRVLNWVPALASDLEDAFQLSRIYAPSIEIDSSVLEQLIVAVRGSTRRVSTNLEMLHEQALEVGVKHISTKELNLVLPHGFVTGESPKPRSF
ncbi:MULTISPECIES: AAA family ATPase [unclassified Acinetobacter]|uniref:AAA family ATPase n=1 Tax=unclassified Acinetobacter TaxID=196816 RepID=UPI001909E054|nr:MULTISPECIES: ATP-binding protein [unclassified Acinetobacter]MBK0062415.1 ATP-binding protein [Acinetobacter sp. S55]MBK0066219.1 ATP-binding protein [Acinetobacter sp. S54]